VSFWVVPRFRWSGSPWPGSSNHPSSVSIDRSSRPQPQITL
jgi:hypothetical protein